MDTLCRDLIREVQSFLFGRDWFHSIILNKHWLSTVNTKDYLPHRYFYDQKLLYRKHGSHIKKVYGVDMWRNRVNETDLMGHTLIIGGSKKQQLTLMADIFERVRKNAKIVYHTDTNPIFNGNHIPTLRDYVLHPKASKSSLDAFIEGLLLNRSHSKSSKEAPIYICVNLSSYTSGFWMSNLIRTVWLNGRHLSMFMIVIVPFIDTAPPEIRNNTKYATSFKYTRKFYEQYGNVVPTELRFQQLADECTREDRYIVASNYSPRNEMFWDSVAQNPEVEYAIKKRRHYQMVASVENKRKRGIENDFNEHTNKKKK